MDNQGENMECKSSRMNMIYVGKINKQKFSDNIELTFITLKLNSVLQPSRQDISRSARSTRLPIGRPQF